jgi:hypothetical protein
MFFRTGRSLSTLSCSLMGELVIFIGVWYTVKPLSETSLRFLFSGITESEAEFSPVDRDVCSVVSSTLSFSFPCFTGTRRQTAHSRISGRRTNIIDIDLHVQAELWFSYRNGARFLIHVSEVMMQVRKCMVQVQVVLILEVWGLWMKIYSGTVDLTKWPYIV